MATDPAPPRRGAGKRSRIEFIQTIRAVILIALFVVGGVIALMTGHSGSGEAALGIGGVLAVLFLVALARRRK